MFDNLTNKFTQAFAGIRTRKLTESNVADAIREVRTALLEADVALEVVIPFVEAVRKKTVGQEFVASVRPGDMFVKFVHDELVSLMGTEATRLDLDKVSKPAIILVAGLQGTGKTTTVAKLAKFLYTTTQTKVMTASADVYRPAAIEQLRILSEAAHASFVTASSDEQPLQIVQRAIKVAETDGTDVLIVDTAGRLAIDDDMMAEIKALHDALKPAETLFVVDAMTGQDAARTARAFDNALSLSGIVLTKADGDARGGAALSVRSITRKPIKFLGTGEDLDGLELFHPKRLASRILGMGDIIGLVEEAERKVDIASTEKTLERLMRGATFTFDDLYAQAKQMEEMGGIESIVDKLPQAGQLKKNAISDATIQLHKVIIESMTPKERAFPNLVNIASRKKRIAAGSGTRVQDVNLMIRSLKRMQKSAKKMGRMSRSGKFSQQLDRLMDES